jgi:general secretion pathway protein L
LQYSAGLAGACPLLARPLNLLPSAERAATSRLRYVPTAALLVLLALCAVALAAVKPIENRRYMEALSRELAGVEPEARKAAALDAALNAARARSRLIDAYRRRSQADLDTLLELTRTLQPPAFLEQVELTRNRAILGGVSGEAAALLKLIDESPRFSGSEFTIPLARVPDGERFRLQATREGAE